MTFLTIIGLAATISGRGVAGQESPMDHSTNQPALIQSEFIFEQAPFASAHASTIAETPGGLVAAWFGGPEEGNPNVCIWVAHRENDRWTAPKEVANGIQADGKSRFPCWNPVLYQIEGGALLLFYKVGPRPRNWWGMLQRSTDNGRTWSTAERLPEGMLGPIKDKPVLWADGSLVCGSSTENAGWCVHLERTPDWGKTWERSADLNKRDEFGLIQPTILRWPSGRAQILNRSRQGVIVESWSTGDWKTWGAMKRTELPNPDSGIDAVMLKDGRALLVYNPTRRGRTPLTVAVSRDGETWRPAVVLENQSGEYSYPAIIQASDGRVHVTYTWKRLRIKHAVIDPTRIQP